MTRIRLCIDRLPFCCGFLEVGEMEEVPEGGSGPDEYYSVEEEYYLPLEKVLPLVLSKANGRPVIFNFVKLRQREMSWDDDEADYGETVKFNRDYNCKNLRSLVKNYPGVVHLHTWENPSSHNRIDSYVIKTVKEYYVDSWACGNGHG